MLSLVYLLRHRCIINSNGHWLMLPSLLSQAIAAICSICGWKQQRTYAYLQVRQFLVQAHFEGYCSSWGWRLPFLGLSCLLIDLIDGFVDDASLMHHQFLPSRLVRLWHLCCSNYCCVLHINPEYLFCKLPEYYCATLIY